MSSRRKLFYVIHLKETLIESLVEDEGSLLQSLRRVRTIPVPCEALWNVKPVQLFGQHYILHIFDETDSKQPLSMTQLVQLHNSSLY